MPSSITFYLFLLHAHKAAILLLAKYIPDYNLDSKQSYPNEILG